MENSKDLSNRKAPAGRPSADELAKREPPAPIANVKVRTTIVEDGIVCPRCDQSMKPFVRKKVGNLKYLQCGKCGSELVHDEMANTVQVLRR